MPQYQVTDPESGMSLTLDGDSEPTEQELTDIFSQHSTKGLIEPGNIDLNNRPIVRHPDGSYSTVKSASFDFGGQEVLLPTVSDDGRMLSNEEAIDLYRKTGKHLGKFDSPDSATAYAKQLHEQQAKQYDAVAQEPTWKSILRPIAQSFVQAPIELQQNVARVPELAAKVAEPIQQTASDVASDFLRRTGIDPSVMPGRPIIEPVSIEERMGPERFMRLPKSVQALVGYHDAAERTASGFTEPGQAALLPVLGFKPAQAVIAAQSLAGAPEVGRRLGEAKTPSETTGALTEGAINALIGAGVGSHLLPRELRVLPKASQAALETIKERIPDASQVIPTATVHGDVPAQPVEGEGQVPVKEGGQGVQPPQVGVQAEVPLTAKTPIHEQVTALRKELEKKYVIQYRGDDVELIKKPKSGLSSGESIPESKLPPDTIDLLNKFRKAKAAFQEELYPSSGPETPEQRESRESATEYRASMGEAVNPKAFQAGFRAAASGKIKNDNPYILGSNESYSWNRGHDQGITQESVPKEPTPTPEAPIVPKVEEQPPVSDVGSGMGGATPSEFGGGVGLKNAIGEVERAQRGLPEATPTQKKAMATTWVLASEELKANPRAGDVIVQELKADPTRGLTDVDSAVLLRHKVAVENALNDAAERTITAKTDAERAVAQDEFARLSDQNLEILDMAKERGSQWGTEGRWRQAIASEDFSLGTMETRMRQAVGGRRLTDAEHTKLVDLNTRLKARVAELEAAQKAGVEASREKATKEAVDEAGKTAGKTKAAKPPDEEIADLKSKIGAKIEKNDHGNITPIVKKLAEQLWLKGVRGLDPMIDSLHGILKEFVPSISRLETMDALSGRGKFTLPSQEAVKVAVRDLSAQARLAAHIEDVQARRPLPRTGPQHDKPTAEQRRLTQQLNELKRKFGVRVTDPAAQLASALSAAKTYTRNRIADLKAEIAARQRIVKTKTPLQPDAELDAMRNELEAVKAEHEQVFGKRQLTDEQKIAIADKMLDRQIAKLESDLESDLEAGRLTPAKRVSTTPETPELLAKRSWLQALREYRQDLRDALNPKLTPEERALKMVKTRIAKQTAEYQEKIAKGDYSKKSRTPTTLDQEAMRAKASPERVKQEWREGLERERLKGRSMREKVRDFIGRWRRELVLSGPSSIFKLMSAAVEGMVIDPIKESVGGAVGKAFPRFAARTELERPSSVAIEAKAWSQAFSHLLDDVVKTVKTGQSDLESAFGGKDAVPPEMRAYMGRLHAALKTPLKRQAWTRSAEILARDYLAKGIDIHDPLIQVEIGNKAFRQANRALFLEDNMVVDAYKRLLSRFEQVKPGQKPTIGQTVGAITLRTALPVVKIPTNLVSRTFQAGFGGFTGSARLATAYAKGIEKLPSAEADTIMRQLKAGLPGSALLLLGFFAPEMFGGYYEPGKKRKPGELKPGHTKIAGLDIPPLVQHNPIVQLPQFGATVRKVMEERVSKYSLETKGIAPGALAASIGLLEETPFINEMLNISKARQAPGKWLGAEAAGVITPQAVSQAAKFTDKDIYGTPIKRKATTFGEQIKVGIPGLRQSVPPSPQQ